MTIGLIPAPAELFCFRDLLLGQRAILEQERYIVDGRYGEGRSMAWVRREKNDCRKRRIAYRTAQDAQAAARARVQTLILGGASRKRA